MALLLPLFTPANPLLTRVYRPRVEVTDPLAAPVAIASGINPAGGVSCTWIIDTVDTVDFASLSFKALHLEPTAGDTLAIKYGTYELYENLIVGASSVCSKSLDCNKFAGEITGACVFAENADTFGVCVCEDGWFNGDCSASVIDIDMREGDGDTTIMLVYTTDANDIRTDEVVQWELEVAVRNAGDVLDAGEGNSEGFPIFVGLGIVAAAIACIVAIASWYKEQLVRKDNELRRQSSAIAEKIREVDDLKQDLKLLQAYDDNEKEMIKNQIMTFRKDHLKSKKGIDHTADQSTAQKDLDKLLIRSDELETHEVIGKGSFGDVYKASYRGAIVAVKTMREISSESLGKFKEEVLLSGDLRHPNIVTMVGACWEVDLMALIMEFCEKGMSSVVLETEGVNFEWDDPLLKWAMDIARAMKYLHQVVYFDVRNNVKVNGIVHRDLKPDNCLVTETYSLKVADFGEARAVMEDYTMTQVGTPLYIAPEIIKGDHYGIKADVFSYAMTLLNFAMKGKIKSSVVLHEWLLESMSDAMRAKLKDKEVNVGRVGHYMIAKDWRPSLLQMLKRDIPKTIAMMLTLLWSDEADKRPTFEELMDYLSIEAKNEISNNEGTGTGSQGSTRNTARKTSTSGGLALKIRAKQLQEEQNETAKGDAEDEVIQLKAKNAELMEEIGRLKNA